MPVWGMFLDRTGVTTNVMPRRYLLHSVHLDQKRFLMATRNEIQLLNLAYFGRPSDPTGLSGWESTGLTSSEIVLRFVATEEYQYNTLPPSEQGTTVDYTSLINRYYQRLFNRSAVQSEIDGWVNAVHTRQ